MDTGGAEAARKFIEAAKPEHPSLIDQAHLLDELYGIINVPSGVWINEEGIIVRPPETSSPARPAIGRRNPPENASPEVLARFREVAKIRIEPEKYIAGLRDWVEKGEKSSYALSPDKVLERSRPRPPEEARAAAHFELGQYLHLQGRKEESIAEFREAHRLQPDNWTYKRQAWTLVDPTQGPNEYYEGDWLKDVLKTGAENYYPPLDM